MLLLNLRRPPVVSYDTMYGMLVSAKGRRHSYPVFVARISFCFASVAATIRLHVYPSTVLDSKGKVITLDLRSRVITCVVSSRHCSLV